MGQYYVAVNIDKRQVLDPHDYDNGAKLMEWSYIGNRFVTALQNLITDEWKGDRVYVVGDYADELKNGSDGKSKISYWANPYLRALRGIGKAVESGKNIPNIYMEASKWPHVLPERPPVWMLARIDKIKRAKTTTSLEDYGYRYIYNHKTHQVIDLAKCPIEWAWKDGNEAGVASLHPLPLLLAMGNGNGNGDYFGNNQSLVGCWLNSVRQIDIQQDLLPGCEGYTEFAPDFTKNEQIIPYTEAERMIAEALKR